MKTHVVKTSPDASLAEVVDLMDIYQVNSVPVVDAEGTLCGLVSEQDIFLAARAFWDNSEPVVLSGIGSTRALQSTDIATTTVSRVMQPAVVYIAEDAEVEEIMRVFFINDFTRIPVVSPDGIVVGTVNRVDVLQAMFEQTLNVSEQ